MFYGTVTEKEVSKEDSEIKRKLEKSYYYKEDDSNFLKENNLQYEDITRILEIKVFYNIEILHACMENETVKRILEEKEKSSYLSSLFKAKSI